jgi:hypothetical protein
VGHQRVRRPRCLSGDADAPAPDAERARIINVSGGHRRSIEAPVLLRLEHPMLIGGESVPPVRGEGEAYHYPGLVGEMRRRWQVSEATFILQMD